MSDCEHCDGTGQMPVMKSTGRQKSLPDGTKAEVTKPGRVPCPFCNPGRGVSGNAPLAGREKGIAGRRAKQIIADEVEDYGSASGSIDAEKFYTGKI